MKKMIATSILTLVASSALAHIPPSIPGRAALTCETGLGKIHLDLQNQVASIKVYCHAAGCSGTGRIKHHEGDIFGDTFLLEMAMHSVPSPSYMIVKVRPDGVGEIFNHPRAKRLFNCIGN